MARKEVSVFNIAFLDLISGALGAVIILYVAVPKNQAESEDKKEYQEIVRELEEKTKEQEQSLSHIEELEDKIKEIEKESLEKSEKIEDAKRAIERIEKIKITKKEEQEESNKESKDTKTKEVGFNFKGKEIIFLIDVSGSMETQDLISEVRAGLKMFITSLTEEYRVEVIFFPDGLRSTQRALWGRTKNMNKKNKEDLYTFLRGLIPFGSTPTRDALLFALNKYPDASDIVLLSDGAPSKPNSPDTDDIEDIIKVVNEENVNRIQINTIGVGPDFSYGERRSSQLYRFLESLAKQNNGFFHGF